MLYCMTIPLVFIVIISTSARRQIGHLVRTTLMHESLVLTRIHLLVFCL